MEPMFEDTIPLTEANEAAQSVARKLGNHKWLTPEEAGAKDAKMAMAQALQLFKKAEFTDIVN